MSEIHEGLHLQKCLWRDPGLYDLSGSWSFYLSAPRGGLMMWEDTIFGLKIAIAQFGLYLGIVILINLHLWWRDRQIDTEESS